MKPNLSLSFDHLDIAFPAQTTLHSRPYVANKDLLSLPHLNCLLCHDNFQKLCLDTSTKRVRLSEVFRRAVNSPAVNSWSIIAVPQISIVLACFNQGDILETTLRSFISQNINPGDYELIVVDDHSEDYSAGAS